MTTLRIWYEGLFVRMHTQHTYKKVDQQLKKNSLIWKGELKTMWFVSDKHNYNHNYSTKWRYTNLNIKYVMTICNMSNCIPTIQTGVWSNLAICGSH